MNRLRIFMCVVGGIAFALHTVCAAQADIRPETRWADPTQVNLDVEFPGDGYHANWELFRCDCGDLLVRSELNIPGEVEKGETLLIKGRAVLSRGFGDRQAELGASLDAPALMMQLTLRLLERSAPKGPASITEAESVEVLDEINPIHLDSNSATGGFQAPWSVQGEIAPAGGDKRRFDLHFAFLVGVGSDQQKGAMRLSGVADFSDGDFPVAASDELSGWTLTWRDENDAAAAHAGSTTTVDDLRQLIQAN